MANVNASFGTGRAGIFEYLSPRQGNGTFSEVLWHWTKNLGYRGHYQSTTFPFNRKDIPLGRGVFNTGAVVPVAGYPANFAAFNAIAQFDRFEIEHWNRANSPSPMNDDLTQQRTVIYIQRLGVSIVPEWNNINFLYGTLAGGPIAPSQIGVNPFNGAPNLVDLAPLLPAPGLLVPGNLTTAGGNSNPGAAFNNWNVNLPYGNLGSPAVVIAPPPVRFTPALQGNSSAFSQFIQAVSNYMFT
jgi:hypothetical protein